VGDTYIRLLGPRSGRPGVLAICICMEIIGNLGTRGGERGYPSSEDLGDCELPSV